MVREALATCDRLISTARRARAKILYAEPWVYAPAIQKEREILLKTGAQILWMIGEESHSGSHSPSYGVWAEAGGGSLVGKGCHPLTAALYLKQEEGRARGGPPIRPATVSARTHEITRRPEYRSQGFLRTEYLDVEDYSQVHVVFEDGMVTDIFSGELVLGGIASWLDIRTNNHRTRCSLNPIDALTTYNPREDLLRDLREVYVAEKIGSKQGWSHPAPDEDWMNGYPQEFQDFMEASSRTSWRPFTMIASRFAGRSSPATRSLSCTAPTSLPSERAQRSEYLADPRSRPQPGPARAQTPPEDASTPPSSHASRFDTNPRGPATFPVKRFERPA